MRIHYLLISLFICNQAFAAPVEPATTVQDEHPIRGLLIFLDDTESSLRAISGNLISAIAQEAGPILASASLIVNIRGDQFEEEIKDPKKLAEEVKSALASGGQADERQWGKFTLAAGSFDATVAQHWIIKEVSSEIYLLLPKTYLQKQGIDASTVDNAVSGPLTELEQKMGLKVNHLKSVQVSDVKKPMPAPNAANYFIPVLDKVFVAKQEYPAASRKMIPQWSLFINGHGQMGTVLAWLTISQFKDFLNFLENKIITRILVYSSCFAAGLTTEKIYADSEKGIDKVYSFPIVTTALTDATTNSQLPELVFNGEKPGLIFYMKFDVFFALLIQAGPFNFGELMKPFEGFSDKDVAVKNIPQVKLAGLSWFSVADVGTRAVAIGSILAKARTEPLDIVNYFTRQGSGAEPEAILLYAQDVPFELIIDTQVAPMFVSMIPGDAVHRLNHLSSENHSVRDILNGFDLKMWGPNKVFVIDKIDGNGLPTHATNAIVISNATQFKAYFSADGKAYKLPYEELNQQEEQEYHAMLKRAGIKEDGAAVPSKTVNPEQMRQLQVETEKLFAQSLPADQVVPNIIKTLTAMPNNSALRVPQIAVSGLAGPHALTNIVTSPVIMDYQSLNEQKILRVDKFTACYPGDICSDIKDAVYDVSPKKMKIVLQGHKSDGTAVSLVVSQAGMETLPEVHADLFDNEFKYFAEHNTLDKSIEEKLEGIEKRSTKQLLSPEAIKKLNETIGSKVQKLEPLSENVQMLKAAAKGDIDAIEKLVATANVAQMPQATKDAALAAAAAENKLDLVQKLVGFGANINGKAEIGDQVLAQVANAGSTDVARYLLEKGVDVNSVSRQGVPALAWAIYGKHYDIARLLIRAGAKVNVNDIEGLSVLAAAAERGEDGLVHLLVEKGADVNGKSGEHGVPVLAYADGSPKIMRYLIGKGARVDERDNLGFTPLMIAAEAGKLDAVKTLLDAKADKNLKNDKDGNKTAYDYALETPNATKQLKSLLKPQSGK